MKVYPIQKCICYADFCSPCQRCSFSVPLSLYCDMPWHKMSSLSAKDVIHISKFNGVNFAFWKVDYLNDNARAIRKWDDKDSIVRLTLLSTLEPQIAMTLQHCETGADMWNRLVIQYEKAAIESKSIQFNKFGHYEYVVLMGTL